VTTKTAPQHGERRCYLRGCRRDECIAANKRYCKQYRLATVREPIRIDIRPAAARLTNWTNQGYSQTQMAAVTNVSAGDLSKLLAGKQQKIHPDVARRILTAPNPAGDPHHAITNATGTIRRGRALNAIGYPIYQIAAGIPMNVNDLGRMLTDPPTTVRVTTANRMTALCRRLRWAPGPSLLARQSAARRQWHGPLVWDDIDDPNEQPNPGADDELNRNELAAFRRQEIAHLAAFGIPEQDIAARLGISDSTVQQQIRDMRKAA
jgi:hypothetical protein